MGSLLKKAAHYAVHNSISAVAVFLMLAHLGLAVKMFQFGITELAVFNACSVILYITGTVMCLRNKILYAYVMTVIEVFACVILSVLFLGWDCGFALYIYCLIPAIIFYSGTVLKKEYRWIAYVMAGMSIFLFGEMFYISLNTDPVYHLQRSESLFFYVYNVVITTSSITIFGVLYVITLEYKNSSLINLNRKLEEDAKNDALTGMLNRRGFIPCVNEAIKKQDMFSIAFCDVDNFKQVNDSYGHDAGDEVLKRIAGIIKGELNGCRVCRWGGEEMVILMKDYDLTSAASKMETIRKIIEKTATSFYNRRIFSTITVGIEEYNSRYETADEIISTADERMYYGKQNGKNRVISCGQDIA